MASPASRPLLLWPISCFDKRREKPFPVYTRTFVLDWSRLSDAEAAEVLAIVDDAEASRKSTHSPFGLGASVVTIERSPRKPDWRMLKFRQFFYEPTPEQLETATQCADRGLQVRLNAEYFEDENGQAITKHEMIQHVSGQKNPVIVGDSESILRLGPTKAVAETEWTVASANTIAQFLEVVERIAASTWHKSPTSITFGSKAPGTNVEGEEPESELLEAIFPDSEETMAVLAYFRQLHAQDRLLEKAAECYLKHSSDERKRWWIDERVKAFKSTVDSPPGLFETVSTRREIVRMFMYGAGMMHSSSHHGDDAALKTFVAKHGREKAVAIFNNCLVDLLAGAVGVYYVIRQDFKSWLDTGLAGPDRHQIDDLFKKFVTEPKNSDE